MRPTRRHHSINGSNSIDQHTPQNGANSHKPTKQKIIGTLSSSHTTHAHPNTPHFLRDLFKAACPTLHTPTQQTKSQSMQIQVKGSINARFPTAISPKPSPNQTGRRGVVGHADSHKATHTHTTTQIARSGGKNRR